MSVELSSGVPPPSRTFPFYAITYASPYNGQLFRWLMYRPLYFFGNNTNTDVAINYSLSPANAAGTTSITRGG